MFNLKIVSVTSKCSADSLWNIIICSKAVSDYLFQANIGSQRNPFPNNCRDFLFAFLGILPAQRAFHRNQRTFHSASVMCPLCAGQIHNLVGRRWNPQQISKSNPSPTLTTGGIKSEPFQKNKQKNSIFCKESFQNQNFSETSPACSSFVGRITEIATQNRGPCADWCNQHKGNKIEGFFMEFTQ